MWAGDALFEWLVDGAPGAIGPAAVVDRICPWLVEAGIPLTRAIAFVRTLHPDVMGRSFEWRPGHATRVSEASWAVLQSPGFLESPVARVFESGVELRLEMGDPAVHARFEVARQLAAEGITDYVALPLRFMNGEVHAITYATSAAGGFTSEHLALLRRVTRPLSRIAEILALSRLSTNLLDAYVGRNAGERILRGRIQRGDSETIRSVVWFSDLRGFTTLSNAVSSGDLIRTLNDLFECQVPAIAKRGGEVLKFIGDGMLAIFPVPEGGDGAALVDAAIDAAREAFLSLATLNTTRAARGGAPVHFGVALHIGDVAYGNIGGGGRLDFTCIGPAVNLAARLEGLAAKLGLEIVISEDAARLSSRALRDVGAHELKGIAGPQRAFTPA